ncbi:sulfatase-modifying factor protein [Candidatus Termititenax persephonae]|uniref:Sulfatase-modifying factor protein n=1 Tax=Candidatus Termititenax persephonae TaxID=2218525 RepID=A0A388TJH4_9BACT|nr:sulfatase-modifying factor protein [Candidatus Termititenax persephonae]
MPNNYNDTYDGIGSGQVLSAEKMTSALNLMEKVANKVETGVLSDGSTNTQYPSAKVVQDSLKEAEKRIVQNTVGKEITANKVTSDNWEANKDSDEKYPTCKAVWTYLQECSDIVEHTANRVSTITADTMDDKYPSAKAVCDLLQSSMPLKMDMDKFVRIEAGIRSFYIAKYETTYEGFTAVMGSSWLYGTHAHFPVYNILWNVAVLYCMYLTLWSDDVADAVKDMIRQSYNSNINSNWAEAYNYIALYNTGCYRLPTSEEWESAALRNRYIWGYNWSDTEMDKYGWWGNNSGGTTHAVGLKNPNAYGLYDVLGNVWEWCSTSYDSNSHVIRGGSWYDSADVFESAYDHCSNNLNSFHNMVGFRLARTA